MNFIIDNPALILAALLILSLVFSISAFALVLSPGHQNYTYFEQPKRRLKVKRYGYFDTAIKVDGITYYREEAMNVWLDEHLLDEKERESVKNLIATEMDHKPWLIKKR